MGTLQHKYVRARKPHAVQVSWVGAIHRGSIRRRRTRRGKDAGAERLKLQTTAATPTEALAR